MEPQPHPNINVFGVTLASDDATLKRRHTQKNWVLFFVNFVDNNKNKTMPSNLLCVSNIKDLLNICGINSEKNKQWIFNRISTHDTRKKWKKISENIIYNNNLY